MPSELDTLVMTERFEAIKSRAPASLVRPGQAWIDDKPRCYKCHFFSSNTPHSGVCNISRRKRTLTTHDFMPGDGCPDQYSPKWTLEDGLTPIPDPKI